MPGHAQTAVYVELVSLAVLLLVPAALLFSKEPEKTLNSRCGNTKEHRYHLVLGGKETWRDLEASTKEKDNHVLGRKETLGGQRNGGKEKY